MANVVDKDFSKLVGLNIVDMLIRNEKTHDSEPNTAIMVNIMVNNGTKKEADP